MAIYVKKIIKKTTHELALGSGVMIYEIKPLVEETTQKLQSIKSVQGEDDGSRLYCGSFPRAI